jgi:hypothetical protein
MNYQNDKRTPSWRALSFMLVSFALIAAAMSSPLYSARSGSSPSPQEQDDDATRGLYNKKFSEARQKARDPRPNAQAQTGNSKRPGPAGPKANPGAVYDDELGDQLIGVTIWRLGQARPGADRTLIQTDGQYEHKRATAEALFNEGELLRISVEAPRLYDNYLYVIDREVYKNNGEGIPREPPGLIFPSTSTQLGETMISAGRSVYVPPRNEIPFTLKRSGNDHIGESVIIMISPEPLPVNVNQPEIRPAMLAQWERKCGGQTERRESRDGDGKSRTKEEQDADENQRKLVQGDPLPQTIYRVRVKPGSCAMVAVPLRIAP